MNSDRRDLLRAWLRICVAVEHLGIGQRQDPLNHLLQCAVEDLVDLMPEQEARGHRRQEPQCHDPARERQREPTLQASLGPQRQTHHGRSLPKPATVAAPRR